MDWGIEALFHCKILDMACGSGAFGVEVFDYLEEIFKALYAKTKHLEFAQYFIDDFVGAI